MKAIQPARVAFCRADVSVRRIDSLFHAHAPITDALPHGILLDSAVHDRQLFHRKSSAVQFIPVPHIWCCHRSAKIPSKVQALPQCLCRYAGFCCPILQIHRLAVIGVFLLCAHSFTPAIWQNAVETIWKLAPCRKLFRFTHSRWIWFSFAPPRTRIVVLARFLCTFLCHSCLLLI